jgi:hypothetical protein
MLSTHACGNCESANELRYCERPFAVRRSRARNPSWESIAVDGLGAVTNAVTDMAQHRCKHSRNVCVHGSGCRGGNHCGSEVRGAWTHIPWRGMGSLAGKHPHCPWRATANDEGPSAFSPYYQLGARSLRALSPITAWHYRNGIGKERAGMQQVSAA